jgi:hypothetical protein
MINELRSLDEQVAGRARELNIRIPENLATESYLEGLYSLLERDRGRCGVFLTMAAGETEVKLQAESLSIAGSRSLQRELESHGCTVDWVH